MRFSWRKIHRIFSIRLCLLPAICQYNKFSEHKTTQKCQRKHNQTFEALFVRGAFTVTMANTSLSMGLLDVFFRFAPITGIEHIFIAWYWKSRIDFLYIWCVYHIQRPNPTSSNKYPIRMRSPNGQKSKTQQCHVTTRVCHTDTRYHTLI